MIEIYHPQMTDSHRTLEAYDQIYAGPGIQLRDSFYLWIIKLLNPKPGGRLLDISCGQGKLTSLAHQSGLHGMGMDFSPQALQLANIEAHGFFAVADGERLPLADGSIDYITHIGSLEHYLNPTDGAKEIGRVLSPTGRAVILLPNAFGLFGNIKYMQRYGDVFDDGQPIQRYATRKCWESILSNGGLVVDRTVAYCEIDFPRRGKDALWLLARPQKVIRWLISQFIPVNLSNHFVFICSSAKSPNPAKRSAN
jgi:SAM-dependent methyltransferase